MHTAVQTLPAGSNNTKPLWAAVSVLGVAVLALGASLIYVQARPVDGHTALAALEQPVLVADKSATPDTTRLPVTSVAPDEAVVQPKPHTHTPTAQRQAQPKVAARPNPAAAPPRATRPVAAPAPEYHPYPTATVVGTDPHGGASQVVITESGRVIRPPVYQPTRAICASCGRVETVAAIERKGTGSGPGVGTVAGGVLGAVVGNQIGKGNGRAIATILGAVGGGIAGNTIEKNMHRETVYRVQVRMEDGSIRTVEQSSPPAIGMAVIVDGNGIRPADGSVAVQTPPRNAAPQARVYNSERI